MSNLAFPRWFYHEFGLVSVHETGRNAYLIIAARTTRMFAFGINSVILAIFLSAIEFSDFRTGLFMTLTLGGDLILGTLLTLIADKFGRRKIMLAGSFMMILSGIVFAIFENFWILLLAAIVGVVSVTGGDFGPFRSIEESILSQLTTTKNRADVLAWYITIATLGTALGSEASGRIVHYLQGGKGWTEVQAYHACFWVYTLAGILNTGLFFCLTEECELTTTKIYTQVAQDESNQPNQQPLARQSKSGAWSWLASNLSQISGTTRAVMYKLWFLLAIDSLADGMVPYSLTNYYLDLKFRPSKATLGDLTSASYFLGAIGSSFAGPLARRIGLINTMVFTHIPSSLAVLLFAAPPYFWISAALLLLRTALNPMDQAPRSAFIAAVVKSDERTAVMGITAMVRTLAAMMGPSATGLFAAHDKFWIAFVAAGAFRLIYDLGLYAMFINMKVDTDDEKRAGIDQEEMELESPRFSLDSASTDISEEEALAVQNSGKHDRLQSPGRERTRGRSPRRASLDM